MRIMIWISSPFPLYLPVLPFQTNHETGTGAGGHALGQKQAQGRTDRGREHFLPGRPYSAETVLPVQEPAGPVPDRVTADTVRGHAAHPNPIPAHAWIPGLPVS